MNKEGVKQKKTTKSKAGGNGAVQCCAARRDRGDGGGGGVHCWRTLEDKNCVRVVNIQYSNK